MFIGNFWDELRSLQGFSQFIHVFFQPFSVFAAYPPLEKLLFIGGIFLFGYARQEALGEHPMYKTLLFTGGIFLSGYAGQEASGIRPM